MGFSIFKFVNMYIFLASLAIGLFFVYIFDSDDKRIIVYPTDENAELLQYRDKTGNCFSARQEHVVCPANKGDISQIPMQG
tara:strand:+ start:2405 stop:2647 length:243 start_codon:yes stop_codon:yes gene_type:complete